jgi:hypothetical protein
MIQHQSGVYKWQFVYLGANQDAFAEAGQVGFQSANVADYVGAATADAFRATSSNVARYRRTARAASLNYSSGQRATLKSTPKR